MKKLFAMLLALVLAAGLLPTAALAAGEYAGKTVVLYTGNVRGDVDVYAQVKAVRDQYAARGADVVLADLGGYLQGAAAANFDRGLSVTRLMDAAGYDVAGMGLAEFGYTDAVTGYPYHGNVTRYYTQAQLMAGAEEQTYSVNRDGSVTAVLPKKEAAKFRAVASNTAALKEGVYDFVPSVTVKTSGLTLHFYAVCDPAELALVQDGYVAETTFALADAGDGVNVVLSRWEDARFSDAVVIEAEDGFAVGAVVIDNKTKAATRESVTLGAADRTVAALAAEVKAQAPAALFTSDVVLCGADSANRNRETNLGDLVTDALLWYAETYMDELDKSVPLVAIQNGGNCDDFLYTGDVTAVDLLKALPFSPMGIGVLQLTGAQLLETLEAGSQRANCAGFVQAAGLSYKLDLTEDYDGGAAYGSFFEADSINRVTILEVGGKPLDKDALYNVVCDNYLISGNDTFYTLKNAKEGGAAYVNNGNGVKTRDVVELYVKNVLGGTLGETYAEPKGRIEICTDFADVSSADSCYDAVRWAVETGLLDGSTKTFGPGETCRREEAVDLLWKRAGKPVVNFLMDFSDVSADAESVRWGESTGVVKGLEDGRFGVGQSVTRAQAATFLWRSAGQPVVNFLMRYDDVEEESWFGEAVRWASSERIVSAFGFGAFGPHEAITRGEFLEMLYRSSKK